MSYTNPQVFTSDPMAFSKGFEASFQKFQDMFEADRKEKERIAEEKDMALASAYNASDLSDIAGLDVRVMNGLQASMDNIIKNGDFANASKSEQAKMLRKISSIKNTIARLGDLASIDPNDWDVRNSNKLTELKSAMLKGDKSIRVEGSGLDLKIVGDFGEVSLDELSSAKFMKKSDYKDVYDQINSDFRKEAQSIIQKGIELGASTDEITAELKKVYGHILKLNGSPEFWSYLLSNETDSEVHRKHGTMYYGDPNIIKGMTPEQSDAFTNMQFSDMADNLSTKALNSIYDYQAFADLYKNKNEPTYAEQTDRMNAITRRMTEERASKDPEKLTATEMNYNVISNALNEKLQALDSDSYAWVSDISRMAREEGFSSNVDSMFFNKMSALGYNVSVIKDPAGKTQGYSLEDKVTKEKFSLSTTNVTDGQIKEALRSQIKIRIPKFKNQPGQSIGSVTSESGYTYN